MNVTSFPGYLAFLMGVFAFAPSIALFHVGGSTGIQLFVVLCVVLIFFLEIELDRWECVFFLAMALIIVAGMTEKFAFEKKIDMIFKGGVSFSLNIFVMFVGLLMCRDKYLIFERYVDGYVLGSVASSSLAIMQFIFLFFLKVPIGLLLGFHNNRGFSDVTSNANFDIVGYGRAFALAPEPAVLALLLLPAAMILLWEKKYWRLLLILAGLYSTQSLTAVLFLLFSFVLYRLISGKARFLECCFYGCCAVLISVFSVFFGQELFAIITLDGLLNRGAGGGSDASSLSRLNSIASGIDAVSEKPWLGWGVQSDGLKIFLLERSTDLEANDSINSLLLSLAAWFGIPLALIFFILGVVGFIFEFSKKITLFVAVSVWPPFLLLNYYSLYSVWLSLGVSVFVLIQKIKCGEDD